MKEYIEREAALEKVIEVKHHNPELSGVVLHRYIKEIDLKDIPAADVAPVVHSYWEHKIANDGENIGICHNCKYPVSWFWEQAKYCFNCGAKMDKEAADGTERTN